MSTVGGSLRLARAALVFRILVIWGLEDSYRPGVRLGRQEEGGRREGGRRKGEEVRIMICNFAYRSYF